MVTNLDTKLSELRKGQKVTVLYYGKFEQEYRKLSGTVVNVDTYWKTLQVNNIGIDFSEICEIT